MFLVVVTMAGIACSRVGNVSIRGPLCMTLSIDELGKNIVAARVNVEPCDDRATALHLTEATLLVLPDIDLSRRPRQVSLVVGRTREVLDGSMQSSS